MEESPGKMYALATVLTLLALVAIGLRVYARRIKQAQLSWDDHMIFPAMLFTIGTAICMYVGTAKGDLGRHTAIDGDGWPIPTDRTIVFQQINYAAQITQTLTFAFTKLSVLLLYRRIFTGELFRRALWVMFAIVAMWTIGFFFSNLLQCWPISTNWDYSGFVTSKCIDTNMMYLAQAWSDVITDVMILSMPAPCIWALQMSTKHKIGVIGIFLTGILTVCAGVAKLVVFRNISYATEVLHDADISYLLTPTVYWPMVESSLGIVGACLPLLRPLFTDGSRTRIVRKIHYISGTGEKGSSQGAGTTAVNSSHAASGKHASGMTFSMSKDRNSGATYNPHPHYHSGMTYNENFNNGLNTHGLLDERDEKDIAEDGVDEISTDDSISNQGDRRADDNV